MLLKDDDCNRSETGDVLWCLSTIPAPSTCTPWHHNHNPQLQPHAGSFAELKDFSTALTTLPQPGLWSHFLGYIGPTEGSAAFYEISLLESNLPTANPAVSLISPGAPSGEIHQAAHPALHSPPSGSTAPGYPLNAWSLLFPPASLVPPHQTGSAALLC